MIPETNTQSYISKLESTQSVKPIPQKKKVKVVVRKKEKLMHPVLEYCRRQPVPDIFKYDITPKVQFYRDHSGGERLKVIQSP